MAALSRIKTQTAATEVDVTDISRIENENKDVLLYEIETTQGLTVLLSGSKACQPILAVHSSEDGLYLREYEELPCGIKFFIDWYKEQVDLRVTLTDWSDFVFDDGYSLRPLGEVERYIEANRHLPDIPSAQQVEKEGVDVGEMNKLLLQKVEELTLYIIDLQKQIDELKSEK